MASDDFNRANETPLASPWTVSPTNSDINSSIRLVSNTVQTTVDAGSLIGVAYYSGAASSADQFSQVTSLGRDSGPAARVAAAATAVNCYSFQAFGGTAEIWKFSNGTISVLGGTGSTGLGAASRVFRLEAEGSSLRSYIGGVQQANTITDGSFASGAVGIQVEDGAGNALDDWSGGDLAPAALPIVAWIRA